MSLMNVAEYLQMVIDRSLKEEWDVAPGTEGVGVEIWEKDSMEPVFVSESDDLQKALDAAQIAMLGRNTIVKLLLVAETAKALLTVKGIKEIAGVEIEKEVDLWSLLKREIAELEEIFSKNDMEDLS